MADRLFLWTGPKHSGKTTGVARLAHLARQSGFRVAGLLAPAVYCAGCLVGFAAVDLHRKVRTPLAARGDEPADVGPFHFLGKGLRLGHHALGRTATAHANLIIVDEFGPLELASRGWRDAVDALVYGGTVPLLLVVRRELAGAVRDVYADVPGRCLEAASPGSADGIIRLLQERR